jgi:nucleoside-diphosphate-sugar epimerase
MTLLSGSSGFLGKHILKEYDNIGIITLGRVNANIICDLSTQIPKLPHLDLIIHTAGKAHSIPKTPLEKQEFFHVNVRGTQNLLKGLEQAPFLPKSFVFISSVAVYGLDKGINIKEDHPLNAKDSYGLSKIQAEQIVEEWCKRNNVICTILRLPLIVGENPPGNLGSMIKAIKKGYYFNIAGGLAKKSMVLADDVPKIFNKVSKIGGIFNLTDGMHPTFKDLSETIAKSKIVNLPLSIAKLLGYFGDYLGDIAPINSLKIIKMTSDLTFDDTKVREFGWDPQCVLEYLKHKDF